jgi:AraC-like DNA-binding protein
MPTTLAPPRPQSASVIAGYGIAIANALEYTGIDSRRVFRAAGVDEELRNDPMHRLSVETVSRLYAICVDVTGSFTFGLTVARFLQASHLHAVGYGALASSTLLDFGQRMTRFMHLVSQSATMEIRESGAETQLVCIVHVPVCPQTLDAWAAFLVRLMRIMHGGDLRPLRVELPHPAPPDGNCRPYLDMFRAPVLFDQRDVVLAFAQDVMRADLPGACPELAQYNDKVATTYLAKLDRTNVVACVRAAIIEQLPSGKCSRESVAATLCLSPETMQSRLVSRHTSFQELLDGIREECARACLSQASLSVTEIAYMTGFTDVSNFTRAFKRWTGQSPSAFRQQGVGSRSGPPDKGLLS